MCTRRSKVSAPLLRPSVMDIPDVFWSCVCVWDVPVWELVSVWHHLIFFFHHTRDFLQKVASICLWLTMLHNWCIVSSPNFMKAVSKWDIFLAIGLKIAPQEVKMPPQCLVFICLSFWVWMFSWKLWCASISTKSLRGQDSPIKTLAEGSAIRCILFWLSLTL